MHLSSSSSDRKGIKKEKLFHVCLTTHNFVYKYI